MTRMNLTAGLTILASCVAAPLFAQDQAPGSPPTQLDPMAVYGWPPPAPRVRMNPHYPMQAKARWEEGCVVLRFTVRPDGKTDDFAILESKPLGVFEKSVIGAVYQWQYDRSTESRTVVESFEFRNQSLSTQAVYTLVSAVNTPAGYNSSGGRKYRLDTQLQGYRPPKCKNS